LSLAKASDEFVEGHADLYNGLLLAEFSVRTPRIESFPDVKLIYQMNIVNQPISIHFAHYTIPRERKKIAISRCMYSFQLIGSTQGAHLSLITVTEITHEARFAAVGTPTAMLLSEIKIHC
jgi:hypothetical protein